MPKTTYVATWRHYKQFTCVLVWLHKAPDFTEATLVHDGVLAESQANIEKFTAEHPNSRVVNVFNDKVKILAES